MRIQELRVGNLLYNEGVVVTIDARTIFDIWDDKGLKKYSPIPITEVWLKKFGFESKGIGGFTFVYKELIGGDSRFVVESDGLLFYPQINFDICCFAEFKYVHQLMNLFYAITGEELTVKDK